MLNRLWNWLNGNSPKTFGVVTFGPNGLELLNPRAVAGLVDATNTVIDGHKAEIDKINDRISKRQMDAAMLSSIVHMINPTAVPNVPGVSVKPDDKNEVK